MNIRRLRIITPIAVLVLAGIGYVAHTGFGTASAIGWQDIAVLCPIGALGTMLASKTIVPRAVISLVIAVIAIILLGRAFCAWACPVPLWQRWRKVLKPKNESDGQARVISEREELAQAEAANRAIEIKKRPKVCKPGDEPNSSRNLVLGGALLSAAIFGFPVFCLVCPVGLSFALVFVLIQLFGAGDVTWSVIAIPVLLVLELLVFRKWCSHICPISALMSLVGRLNRTFRTNIDDSKCVETSHGVSCGRCSQVCPEGVDPRHPQEGANAAECTKCGECLIACPASAIKMPFISKKAVRDAATGESAGGAKN